MSLPRTTLHEPSKARSPCKVQTIDYHLKAKVEFVIDRRSRKILSHFDRGRIGLCIKLSVEATQVRAFSRLGYTRGVLLYRKTYHVVSHSGVGPSCEFRRKPFSKERCNPAFTGRQPIGAYRNLGGEQGNKFRVCVEYPIEFFSDPHTSLLPRLPRNVSIVGGQFTQDSVNDIRQYFGFASDVSIERSSARVESVGKHTHTERLRAFVVDSLKRRSNDLAERNGRAPWPTVLLNASRAIHPPLRTPGSIRAPMFSSHTPSIHGMGMRGIYRAAASHAVRTFLPTNEVQQKLWKWVRR
jgi:hypothetical protein